MKAISPNDQKWQGTLKYATGDYRILGIEAWYEKYEIHYDYEEELEGLSYDDIWKWSKRPFCAQWYEEKIEDYRAKVLRRISVSWDRVDVMEFLHSFTGRQSNLVHAVQLRTIEIQRARGGDDYDSSKKFIYQWYFIPKDSKYDLAKEGQKIIDRLNPIDPKFFVE